MFLQGCGRTQEPNRGHGRGVTGRWGWLVCGMMGLWWLGGACGPVGVEFPSPCPIAQVRGAAAYEQPSPYDDPRLSYTVEQCQRLLVEPAQGANQDAARQRCTEIAARQALCKSQPEDPSCKRSPYTSLFSGGESRGCWVLSWPDDGADGKIGKHVVAIRLKEDGNVLYWSESLKQYTESLRLAVSPPKLEKSSLSLAMVMIRPDVLGNAKDAALEESHRSACSILSVTARFQVKEADGKKKTEYNCFQKDLGQTEPCWFFFKLQPKITEENKAITFSTVANSCEICSREVCGNTKDDDCDGQVDEGCGADDCHHKDARRPCYDGPAGTAGKGICREGHQVCADDGKGAFKWGACQEAVKPQTQEICNGIDDNCDGQTDEGLTNCCIVGQRRACYSGPAEQAGKGICLQGAEVCEFSDAAESKGGGAWGACVGSVLAAPREQCNGQDDDCNGQIDDGLSALGSCDTGVPTDGCKDGERLCENGRERCKPKATPTEEICNGKDDNCDGQIDEVFPKKGLNCTVAGKEGACAEGIFTACQNGVAVCTQLQEPEAQERCDDGVDNDCNGKIDADDPACQCKPGAKETCYTGTANTAGKGLCKEGERVCLLGGRWGPCEGQIVPKPEECNNQDDDCNGQVDEDFVGKDASCNVIGQRGPCRFGKKTCVNGAIVCQQSVTAAPAENCANGGNGIDDDCNGLVDDGCTCPMDGRQIDCYGGPTATRFVSPCHPGKLTCGAGGIWGGCIGEQTPNFIELCNGIDDNCDGFVDEGNPEGGAACVVSAQKGICQAGTQKCQNGVLTCVSNQTAQTEVCNGKDDDCDGQTDETDPRLGRACTVTGQKGPCAVGEIACRNGQLECQKKVQSAAETCDGTDEDCDGKIDNVPNAPACPKQDGVCKGATQLCAGKTGFVACTAGDYYRKNNNYEVAETRCDGLDNDCDGKVDIGRDGKALSRPCYDGPANTRSVGACKDGVQTCENGQWGACKDQVKPNPERCGNLLDDDCNGIPDAKEANCSCWGGGTAGEFLVRNTIVLDKAPRKNSSLPEIYWAAVEAFKDGAKTVTVSDAAGFDPGDAAVLIHMQGSKDRVGIYELVRVLEKTGKDIKLQAAVEKIYGATTNDDLSGQKVRLVRVPTFERVIIDGQGELTVSAWDGNQGGLLVMQVKEYVRVANGGRLHVDGKGYRGAPSVSGTTQPGTAGESFDALPSQEGGGSAGSAGAKAASGGGGGYVEAGVAGKDSDGQAAGTGGKTYGGTLEDRLVLGSGGGAGGIDNSSAGNKNDAVGAGGAGGGIILLWARTLNLNGGFSARGLAGGDAASAGGSVGGGGGGSGGSVYVVAERVVLYDQTAISAAGGEGGRSSVLEQGTRKLAGKSIGGSGSLGKIEIRIGKDTNNKRLLFGKELGGFSPVPTLSELPATCN